MKLVFCAIVAFAFANASPAKQVASRYYDPEEDNIDRVRYIYMPDESGKIHLVDLQENRDVRLKVVTSDVTFYLYTKNNQKDGHEISAANIQSLTTFSLYDKKKPNLFIVHGWTSNNSAEINVLLTAALLGKYDVNVFIVDWSGPASAFYTTAKGAVPDVGVVIGDFINDMITKYDLSPSDFNLIGHSLGAHVAGCAGAQVAKVHGKVNYILGLDPAGPLYTVKNTDNRIDPTDGQFVEIIHTNGGLLGFSSAIGHADYYPNGGKSQPGCGVDLAGGCSHSRSYIYLAESIRSQEFQAVLCDSYKNFENGKCKSNAKSFMGGFLVDKSAKGDYYLKTGSSEPFALGAV